MHIREKKLLENAGWLLALQAVNILLPFVTVPYVTRVFGTDGYGVFSIALNWVTYFQLVIEYGFNLSATKKVVGTKNVTELNRLVSAVVFARMGLVGVCFLIVLVLGATSAATGDQLACMLVLFSMLVGIAIQLNWLFQGLQDMKVITIATAAARSLSVLLVFLLIKYPNQLMLYSLLYSITFLLSGLITHIFARKRYGVRIGLPSLRQILEEMRDGMPIFLSSAAGKLIGNVGITVLGSYSTSAIVGSYAAILKIPQMVSLMFTPIGQALYPRINEECIKSRRGAAKLVVRFGLPTVVLFGLGLFGIAVLRVPLVSLLFGEEYLLCADTLIPLAMWVLLGIVNNFIGVQLLIPFGRQSIYSALMIADSILSLALNFLLGYSFGAMGVASAIAISEAALTMALILSLLIVVGPSRLKAVAPSMRIGCNGRE
ncbi:oligosaccharide flippase family protein [Collinsella phocaeensis]|uniref:oligosaccharide flippase family protein n=1 Tax=Collinsella phocaeensis TaxID=1871016 RepID=UPI00093149CB|nr:oligosaccharide flippase family protein [Collinsella phocaeensis]